MSNDRAYARIGRGAAVLGNTWYEREWTGFSGATVSFLHKAAERDWTAGPSPEFELVVDGHMLALMDFSAVEIDETAGPYGAGLVMRRMAPNLHIRSELTAYHDLPLLVRRTLLINPGDRALRIERFVDESLQLASPRIELRYNAFADAAHVIGHQTDERAVALHGPGAGWLVGREGGARYALGETGPGAFQIAAPAPIPLEPGAVLELPRILWIAYTGAPEPAAQKLLGEALLLLRQQDKDAAARENDRD